MDYDKIIFGKKKYSDLLSEIYNRQDKKNKQIDVLINELKDLVVETSDATLIVPMIKAYLETGVKNDDLFLKLAALIQRGEENKIKESDFDGLGISDSEKEALLKIAKEK
jgi:hypothetical protein